MQQPGDHAIEELAQALEHTSVHEPLHHHSAPSYRDNPQPDKHRGYNTNHSPHELTTTTLEADAPMREYNNNNQHMHYRGSHKKKKHKRKEGSKKVGIIRGPEDGARTLWVGDLGHWVDENIMFQMFAGTGEDLVDVKVIRDRISMASMGYGFAEFQDTASAQRFLLESNGKPVPATPGKVYRLNWAQFGIHEKRPDSGEVFSLFAGDLDSEVTDYLLESTFRSMFPSVSCARVVVDNKTGRSKGYGFVRFGDKEECSRAIQEMNGVSLLSRPMRIDHATPRRKETPFLNRSHSSNANSFSRLVSGGEDLSNTTLFVGGLDNTVSVDQLRSHFEPFGNIHSVRIPAGKGCGFVHFVHREGAAHALQELNGMTIGSAKIRLSWGHSSTQRRHHLYPAFGFDPYRYPMAFNPPQYIHAGYPPQYAHHPPAFMQNPMYGQMPMPGMIPSPNLNQASSSPPSYLDPASQPSLQHQAGMPLGVPRYLPSQMLPEYSFIGHDIPEPDTRNHPIIGTNSKPEFTVVHSEEKQPETGTEQRIC